MSQFLNCSKTLCRPRDGARPSSKYASTPPANCSCCSRVKGLLPSEPSHSIKAVHLLINRVEFLLLELFKTLVHTLLLLIPQLKKKLLRLVVGFLFGRG